MTCGVWVGFDRPTKIFRGAFGKDLALPIWVKTMNASAEVLPANKFPRPDTLKPVEICRTSGLLATPRCVLETPNGEMSLAYTEYATEAEIPQIRCDIHGGGIRNYAKEYGQEEWPRPVMAVDLATIRPIAVTAPTLLGLNDVYNSVRPQSQRFDGDIPVKVAIPVKAEEKTPAETPEGAAPPAGDTIPTDAPAAQAANAPAAAPVAQAAPAAPTPEPEVRKAEAVKPLDQTPMDSPAIQAPTPEPISFQ